MESAKNDHSPATSRNTPHRTETQKTGFAFLVNTQNSLGQNSAPNIGNQRLARQKRRRTSPKDHATLEAEYERNPKPDKAARQEIVKRVALAEKEVQIWFQNRRQITRRKMRPLSNQELDMSMLSSQERIENARCSSFSAYTSSQQSLTSSQSSITGSQCATVSKNATEHPAKDTKPSSVVDRGPGNAENVVHSKEGTRQTFKADSNGAMQPREPGNIFRSISQTTPGKRRPGYFANRRSAPFIMYDDDHDTTGVLSKNLDWPRDRDGSDKDAISGSREPLRRTTSLIKLSMDSEGKAEIMPRTGNTPSPPHSRSGVFIQPGAPPFPRLRQSFSAVEPCSDTQPPGLLPSSFGQRKATGRSRDARTWEFYCDSDARNALTEQAEREERGSAAAALGLIRSHSQNNKTLTPNLTKRNAHISKQDSAKRRKADVDKPSKPTLARATSSGARLQMTNANGQKQKATKPVAKHRKSSSQSTLFEDFEGDSDKENWEPGTQAPRPPRRSRVTSQDSTRILLESVREPSQSSTIGAVLSRESKKPEDEVNGGPDIDDEIAAFMRERALPREEEDLDCVQNLLSLSQAVWE